jgi:hypothetical protein
MRLNIERGLVHSRRVIKRYGGLEPDPKKATAAHSIYSFCIAHMFEDWVELPRELEPSAVELNLEVA